MSSLAAEEGVGGGAQGGLLALAGDAIALAVAALRLGSAPKAEAAASAPHSVPPLTISHASPPQTPAPTPAPAPAPASADLPEVSLAQVAWHDHMDDCWVVVYDTVYDLTAFLSQHPGGGEILLEYAGRDATLAFAGIGHGPCMLAVLRRWLVGCLPPAERIYRAATPGEHGGLQLLQLS